MSTLERIHLTIVREVERTGSLTAAARSLGLTQSALSHTVGKLERDLGTNIWQRKGRGLALTQAGQQLLALSARVLPQLEHGEAVLQEFADGKRGMLRIGIECHPCHRWLMKVVGPYLEAYPNVDLDVKQAFKFGGIAALYAREIDLLVTPDPLRRNGLVFERVFDYEHVLVVSTRHRLAGKRSVHPTDLESETLITYPVEVERLDVYSKFLMPGGVVPRRRQIVESTDILLQLVEKHRGVAALPKWLVREYAKTFEISPLRLGKAGMKKSIHLGTRSVDATVAYLVAFKEMARNLDAQGKARARR